jgi:RNA polymerase sigma-70 factor (ECF subfamily)
MGDPEAVMLQALLTGDEAAFAELVRRYHNRLLRLARSFVPSAAVAEEVVQDTWLAVVKGADRFEGRSSVRTWLFRILVNRARHAGAREPRTWSIDADPAFEARLDGRFGPSGEWSEPPVVWSDRVDDRLVAAQLAACVVACLPALPEGQRQVLLLRDIESLDAATVSELLDISAGNQRVLLHRARTRLRFLLEQEMGGAIP